MFFCGNDAAAKADVARLLEQFGWEPADMGTVVAARAIEPLAQLWGPDQRRIGRQWRGHKRLHSLAHCRSGNVVTL